MNVLVMAGVVLGLIGAPAAPADSRPSADPARPLRTLRAGHPRVLVTEERFAALRDLARSDAELARILKGLRSQAVKLLEQPVSRYVIPDGKRLLATSRRVLDRVMLLGLFYHLEGDKKYLDRAWKELDAVCKFKDWNPSHFLDTAEMTLAVGIGYDWFYAGWTAEQRRTLREGLLRHGLQPGMACYSGKGRGYGGWIKSRHNWNQVCNGGLVGGALAIADEEPEVAGKIVSAALSSIQLAMAEYAPDGAYKEGIGYWFYGTGYNIYLIATLESALGTDFGLSRSPGFDKTGLFVPSLTGPTGEGYSFADTHEGKVRNLAALRWLGARFDNPRMLQLAAAAPNKSVWDVLWYRPLPSAPADPGPRCRHWPGAQVATLRTSWTDPNATFLALKGGSPSYNHAQADLGSFVLDRDGVRWAIDLGSDNYNLPGYFDGRKGRWRFYRNRAEGHNTLVVGPSAEPDQVMAAKCAITRFGDDQHPYAVVDLTRAYRQAKRIERGFQLTSDGGVLVQDEIALATPEEVLWFLHSRATIELSDDGRTATLRQGKQSLPVHLVQPANARFEVMDAVPLSGSPTVPGQAENKGVRKLVIRLRGVTNATLAVSLGGAAPGKLAPLADWK